MFENFNLLRAAALAGQGVALCSLAMIELDLTEGRLVQRADEAVLEDFEYDLTQSSLAPAHGIGQRARRLFLSWIKPEKDYVITGRAGVDRLDTWSFGRR